MRRKASLEAHLFQVLEDIPASLDGNAGEKQATGLIPNHLNPVFAQSDGLEPLFPSLLDLLGRIKEPNFHVQAVQFRRRKGREARIFPGCAHRGLFEGLPQRESGAKKAATGTKVPVTFQAHESPRHGLIPQGS
jgi:hypothetical protein